MNIATITNFLSNLVPHAYQESYDNCGVNVGDIHQELTGILIALDTLEIVIEEAIALKINLIISHHPVIFKGIKSLKGSNYTERIIIKAIQHNIVIYCIHTNLDNFKTGVSFKIAEKLGLNNCKILLPKSDLLGKLTTFIPSEFVESVSKALFSAGAGQIGNYTDCSFQTTGTGTFTPNTLATPFIGQNSKKETVQETRLEVIFPIHLQKILIKSLHQAHPYEEVAYYVQNCTNENQDVGSGVIGTLEEAIPFETFLNKLKHTFHTGVIRYTNPIKKIKTVAVCGGAGSFLLKHAIQQNADIYISGDFKYHEFFDADGKIMIADIGHYESEQFTSEIIKEMLEAEFDNLKLHIFSKSTNPVFYWV